MGSVWFRNQHTNWFWYHGFETGFETSLGGFTKQDHCWWALLYRFESGPFHSIPIEPFRKDLDDNSEVKLTNGDLHRRNVMVISGQYPRIMAIVDWEQSGWFPAYWEIRKALYTWHGPEWATKYIPMILDRYDITAEPWDYYVTSLGN